MHSQLVHELTKICIVSEPDVLEHGLLTQGLSDRNWKKLITFKRISHVFVRTCVRACMRVCVCVRVGVLVNWFRGELLSCAQLSNNLF